MMSSDTPVQSCEAEPFPGFPGESSAEGLEDGPGKTLLLETEVALEEGPERSLHPQMEISMELEAKEELPGQTLLLVTDIPAPLQAKGQSLKSDALLKLGANEVQGGQGLISDFQCDDEDSGKTEVLSDDDNLCGDDSICETALACSLGVLNGMQSKGDASALASDFASSADCWKESKLQQQRKSDERSDPKHDSSLLQNGAESSGITVGLKSTLAEAASTERGQLDISEDLLSERRGGSNNRYSPANNLVVLPSVLDVHQSADSGQNAQHQTVDSDASTEESEPESAGDLESNVERKFEENNRSAGGFQSLNNVKLKYPLNSANEDYQCNEVVLANSVTVEPQAVDSSLLVAEIPKAPSAFECTRTDSPCMPTSSSKFRYKASLHTDSLHHPGLHAATPNALLGIAGFKKVDISDSDATMEPTPGVLEVLPARGNALEELKRKCESSKIESPVNDTGNEARNAILIQSNNSHIEEVRVALGSNGLGDTSTIEGEHQHQGSEQEVYDIELDHVEDSDNKGRLRHRARKGTDKLSASGKQKLDKGIESLQDFLPTTGDKAHPEVPATEEGFRLNDNAESSKLESQRSLEIGRSGNLKCHGSASLLSSRSSDLSYLDSEEPGEESQANALKIVDKLVWLNASGLSQDAELEKKLEHSDLHGLQSAKGVPSLAHMAETKRLQEKMDVFDWVDSQLQSEAGFPGGDMETTGISASVKKGGRISKAGMARQTRTGTPKFKGKTASIGIGTHAGKEKTTRVYSTMGKRKPPGTDVPIQIPSVDLLAKNNGIPSTKLMSASKDEQNSGTAKHRKQSSLATGLQRKETRQTRKSLRLSNVAGDIGKIDRQGESIEGEILRITEAKVERVQSLQGQGLAEGTNIEVRENTSRNMQHLLGKGHLAGENEGFGDANNMKPGQPKAIKGCEETLLDRQSDRVNLRKRNLKQSDLAVGVKRRKTLERMENAKPSSSRVATGTRGGKRVSWAEDLKEEPYNELKEETGTRKGKRSQPKHRVEDETVADEINDTTNKRPKAGALLREQSKSMLSSLSLSPTVTPAVGKSLGSAGGIVARRYATRKQSHKDVDGNDAEAIKDLKKDHSSPNLLIKKVLASEALPLESEQLKTSLSSSSSALTGTLTTGNDLGSCSGMGVGRYATRKNSQKAAGKKGSENEAITHSKEDKGQASLSSLVNEIDTSEKVMALKGLVERKESRMPKIPRLARAAVQGGLHGGGRKCVGPSFGIQDVPINEAVKDLEAVIDIGTQNLSGKVVPAMNVERGRSGPATSRKSRSREASAGEISKGHIKRARPTLDGGHGDEEEQNRLESRMTRLVTPVMKRSTQVRQRSAKALKRNNKWQPGKSKSSLEVPPSIMHVEGRRRKRDSGSVRVLFSHSLSDDIAKFKHQKRILARLGGHIADSAADCTHFVTDTFFRTRNMLESMAAGKPIVTSLWLESCGQGSYFVDEKKYILHDFKKEKELGFSMMSSLAAAQQKRLLKNVKVLLSPNISPEPKSMEAIVEAAGGQVVQNYKDLSDVNADNGSQQSIVIACEDDYDFCLPLLVNGFKIYSTELVLSGILVQALDFSKNQLFEDYAQRPKRIPKHSSKTQK